MKNRKKISVFALLSISLSLFVIWSCEDEDVDIMPPSINLYLVNDITETTASVGVAFWPGHHSSTGKIPFIDAGLVWKKNYNSSLEDHDGIFTGAHFNLDEEYNTRINIVGLEPGTPYYLRAYGINKYDTAYSITQTFETLGESDNGNGDNGTGNGNGDIEYGENISDIDGNEYSTVIIGQQQWMAENLRTTTFNDGTSITHAYEGNEWVNLKTAGYAWYDNDESYGVNYGALYNWYAANSDQLCPDGWRVATDDDWTQLTSYLGGESVAGGKLKATGTVEDGDGLWDAPNEGATNETGFSALPGGSRYVNASFLEMGNQGFWWTTLETTEQLAMARRMHAYFAAVQRTEGEKTEGYAVRCIKN